MVEVVLVWLSDTIYVVVDGACSTLDDSVCAKVEVVLVRLSDSRLDQSAR